VTAGARRAPRTDLSGARHGGCAVRPSSTALVVPSLGVLSVLPAIFGWRRNQTSSTFCRGARELRNIFIAGLPCRSCGSQSARNRVVCGMLMPPRPALLMEWLWSATSSGPGSSHSGPYIEHQTGGQVASFFLLTKIIGISGSGANIARSAECDRGQRDSALAVFQGNFELSKGVKNQNEIGCWHSASKHVRGADFDELPSGLTSASSVEPSSGSKTVELRPSAWPSRWRAWACS